LHFRLYPDRRRPRRDRRQKADDALSDSLRRAAFQPIKSTGVPFLTRRASVSASQLVSRMQPCDCVLPIASGSGVPWMPYPFAESAIHTTPTGLFGPGFTVTLRFVFCSLK